MRGAILLALLVAGCAKNEAAICTPLAPQSFIDGMKAKASPNGATTGYVAADCLIVHAREFATNPDPSAVVAKAVVDACRAEIQATEAAAQGGTVGEFDDAASKAALVYVSEARAGHCSMRRDQPPRATGLPNLYDWR